jgi:hypothetical protein
VENKINNLQVPRNDVVKQKLQAVLQKNPGLQTILETECILSGREMEGRPKCLEIYNLNQLSFKYAPVTSISVERSFYSYKYILSDRRQTFTVDNLERVIVSHCNVEGRKL